MVCRFPERNDKSCQTFSIVRMSSFHIGAGCDFRVVFLVSPIGSVIYTKCVAKRTKTLTDVVFVQRARATAAAYINNRRRIGDSACGPLHFSFFKRKLQPHKFSNEKNYAQEYPPVLQACSNVCSCFRSFPVYVLLIPSENALVYAGAQTFYESFRPALCCFGPEEKNLRRE